MTLHLENGRTVDNPEESQISAALRELSHSGQRTLTIVRSPSRWLRVEVNGPGRFHLYSYAPWRVSQSRRPASQRVTESMVQDYAAGKRSWRGAVPFAPIETSFDEAVIDDADPEAWRKVATADVEFKLAHAPEVLRNSLFAAALVAVCVAAGWGASAVQAGLVFVGASLLAVAYVTQMFKTYRRILDDLAVSEGA